MGLFSSKGAWGDKPAVTREMRARAIRVQEEDERDEKRMKKAQQLRRDRDKGRARGWW